MTYYEYDPDEEEYEPDEYDPGDAVDDEGGMSEYRSYMLGGQLGLYDSDPGLG